MPVRGQPCASRLPPTCLLLRSSATGSGLSINMRPMRVVRSLLSQVSGILLIIEDAAAEARAPTAAVFLVLPFGGRSWGRWTGCVGRTCDRAILSGQRQAQ